VARRAILLDRDGTICPEIGLVLAPQQIDLWPTAVQAVVLAVRAGFLTVLVTNQAAVALGQFSEARLDEIHERLRAVLAGGGARLDGVYACPHHPRGLAQRYAVECACRKPRPGLLGRAREEMGIDLSASWLVGDRLDDVAAGARAGSRTVLVRTGRGASEETRLAEPDAPRPDRVAADVLAAVAWIAATYGSQPGAR